MVKLLPRVQNYLLHYTNLQYQHCLQFELPLTMFAVFICFIIIFLLAEMGEKIYDLYK